MKGDLVGVCCGGTRFGDGGCEFAGDNGQSERIVTGT